MSNEDWYRNEIWNSEIEAQFIAKLKRARRKEQYLRIQASTLADKIPEIALELLKQYFELKDNFDHAQAYCDRATAYIALGKLEEAVDSFRSALKRESEFPNLLTEAYIEFPMMVAQNKMVNFISEANAILDQNQHRLMFPVDYFRWHAAKAIFEAELGNNDEAAIQAGLALDIAKIKKSGFKYHQHLGIVDAKYRDIIYKLKEISARHGNVSQGANQAGYLPR